MKKLALLIWSILLTCCGSGTTKEQDHPTIVKASISFSCNTRTSDGQALMSDGSFQPVTIYPANNASSVSCPSGFGVFSIVDCHGTTAGFFCLPQNFTCNYLTQDDQGTLELCST